jgi:hypothetical protein
MPDTLVTGTLPVEMCGDVIRVTLYADRMDPETGERLVRVIVGRLVFGRADYLFALRQAMAQSLPALCLGCPDALKRDHSSTLLC